jgi:hypothetical protein
MTAKILGTLAVAVYALAVPLLELNATHLFNPEWPPHARTHEAWQLLTNTSLGMLALWALWRRGDVQLAGQISLLVMGGFLVAFLLQDTYGGSMVLSSVDPEKTVLGINLGVVGALLSLLCAASSMTLSRRAARHGRGLG